MRPPNGRYDAKLDHQPVVAVVGQQKPISRGAHYQQEVALEYLLADVSEFVQICMHPAQARHVIEIVFVGDGAFHMKVGQLLRRPGRGATWQEALASEVPVVLELKVDNEIAPIPPHVMSWQAKKAARAMLSDPEKWVSACRPSWVPTWRRHHGPARGRWPRSATRAGPASARWRCPPWTSRCAT